jgi:hypothetical protein
MTDSRAETREPVVVAGSAPGEHFYPSKGTVCTEAFSRFLSEYRATLDSFFFVIELIRIADEGRVRAAAVLAKIEPDGPKRADYERSAANPDLALKEMRKHGFVNSKNLTNGIVNSFQSYFSSIIASAASKKPELLSSSQTIKIEDVLRFSRLKDVVAFIIDRKINDLSYGGLTEMERYFDERLGVAMFDNDAQRRMLRFFIESRNINVHNAGVVNDLFASRVGVVEGFEYEIGQRLHIDFDELVKLSQNAMQVALRIDGEVGEKFRILRRKHDSWERRRAQPLSAIHH